MMLLEQIQMNLPAVGGLVAGQALYSALGAWSSSKPFKFKKVLPQAITIGLSLLGTPYVDMLPTIDTSLPWEQQAINSAVTGIVVAFLAAKLRRKAAADAEAVTP